MPYAKEERYPTYIDMKAIPAGTLKRIHINRHVIRDNKRRKKKLPPFRIKTSKENIVCMRLIVVGMTEFIYSPDKPLKCGATAWVETREKILWQK